MSDGGHVLPVPETAPEEGSQVIYGIRPENIQIGESGVPMSVVVVEPTGSETQVFAKSGGDLIDALEEDRIMARPGSEIGYFIDPTGVHLFDRETEQHL